MLVRTTQQRFSLNAGCPRVENEMGCNNYFVHGCTRTASRPSKNNRVRVSGLVESESKKQKRSEAREKGIAKTRAELEGKEDAKRAIEHQSSINQSLASVAVGDINPNMLQVGRNRTIEAMHISRIVEGLGMTIGLFLVIGEETESLSSNIKSHCSVNFMLNSLISFD